MTRVTISDPPGGMGTVSDDSASSHSAVDDKDLLFRWIGVGLEPAEIIRRHYPPLTSLPDAEVARLAELRYPSPEHERFSELLEAQRNGSLRPEEQAELQRLVRLYEVLLLRQSQALAEAVGRGLIKPLSS